MPDLAGQRLDSYHIISLLGTGSFGEVYLAEHIYRKERVAIKILPLTADSGLSGFLNEARAMRLKHPHIAQIIDFGVDHHIPFIVMEYAPNGTLRQRHPKEMRVPLDAIVPYVLQIASALEYAHSERVIHRDIKPENLLVGSKNEVLVSDFGISMMAHSLPTQSLLKTGGTVAYMAPEQLHGKPRFASDQYALGVVVYEWLSGERPFNGTTMEIATQHLLTPPLPLHKKVPNISREVEEIVLKALAKAPHDRFPTIQAFAKALKQASLIQKPKQQQPRHTNPNLTVSPVSADFPLSLRREHNELSATPSPVRNHREHTPPITSPKLPIPPKAVPSKPPIAHTIAQPLLASNPFSAKAPSSRAFTPPGGQEMLNTHSPGKNRTRIYSLLMLIALGVILASGSIYYFLAQNSKSSIAVDATLTQATLLISQAGTEETNQPADALKKLANAQILLRSIPSSSLTDTQRAKLNSLLQIDFRLTAISAITNYNQQAAITMLPCTSTKTIAINNDSNPQITNNIVVVQDTNGQRFSYVRGDDSNVYQLDDQHHLVNKLTLTGNPKVTMIASDMQNQRVLALTTQPATGTMPASYGLSMLAPTHSGALKDTDDANIDPAFTQGGDAPTLLTAWGTDVYALLTSTATQDSVATILDFETNGSRLLKPRSIKIITPISPVSIAAFPNRQLFLLYHTGIIQSLVLNGDNYTPVSVATESPIASPLTVSVRDFATNTAVPTPPDQAVSSSLIVSGASTLLTAVVNNVLHLYVMDDTYHRIIDLKTTQNLSTSVTMKLVQQYVSASLLNQVNGIAVDPQEPTLYLLTQQGPNTTALNLISLDVSQKNACTT